MTRSCSVAGCPMKVFARGMCYSHWRKWKRAQPPPWRKRFLAKNPPKDGIGLVPLTRGKVALVDVEDYPRVIEHLWFFEDRYALTRIDGTHVSLGRFIMEVPDTMRVRYRDGDGFNCRRANLEVCTNTEVAPLPPPKVPKTSRFKGVCRHSQGTDYTAQLYFKGNKLHLGYFRDEVEAALARDEKALELFGSGVYLNFPDR